MEINSPLPQIKAAIYRANLELMEVSEGCHYHFFEDGKRYDRKVQYDTSILGLIEDSKRKEDDPMFVVIDGHPIHLEHILRAINTYNVSNVFSDHNLAQIKYYNGDQERFFSCFYNLAKSFEDQEPETLEFLYQLLVKE